MEVDSGATLTTRSGRHRDMDGTANGFQQSPKSCGRAVTQDRPLPAREHRRHPAPVHAERAVTNCVNASVNSVELPSLDSSHSRSSTQARSFELPNGDHPVLPRGDSRHLSVKRVAFVPHEVTKSTGLRPLPLPRFFSRSKRPW